jgi:hypothetical protein
MWVDGVWALHLASEPMCWSHLSSQELNTDAVSWPNALLDPCPGMRRILILGEQMVDSVDLELGGDARWRRVWEQGDPHRPVLKGTLWRLVPDRSRTWAGCRALRSLGQPIDIG